jgi:hypothetical protein
MAQPLTPWSDQRARHGKLSVLVRVINLDAQLQEFVMLHPRDRKDLEDLQFDGETVVLPEQQRTEAEIAEIVARFDALYWTDPKNKTTRHSVLDREKYLRPR